MDLDDEELEATRRINRVKRLTADEMFEELGYKKYDCVEETEYYHAITDKVISFRDNKTIRVYDYYDGTAPITMQELKLINKKCKELGWNE